MFEMALDPRRTPGRRVRDRVLRQWRTTWTRMVRLGGISDGNVVQVFFDGDEAFEAMFGAIDAARRRVWQETYIWEDDRIGQGFKDRLIAAAARGCEVVLLYDQWGSAALPEAYFADLVAAGARVVAFNPVRLPFAKDRAASPLVRDHRKILIVDDEVGFVGGMNVSEDYAGQRLGRHVFRDTHACVRGPAVKHLGDIFLDGLRLGAKAPFSPTRTKPAPSPEGALVQVLRSNVLTRRLHIQRALRHAVRRSIERCWLTTPYFVPPRRLVRQLMRASRRGVDVRVLTAGKSDVPAVRLASQYLYAQLLKAGVKVFEMQDRTLHAKTAVIDGLYSTVGSFNLDHWSYRRNLEVNVALVDKGLAERMEARFEEDLTCASAVELEDLAHRSLWQRFLSWLAYQAARM
jgi:cardiolipin synthase